LISAIAAYPLYYTIILKFPTSMNMAIHLCHQAAVTWQSEIQSGGSNRHWCFMQISSQPYWFGYYKGCWTGSGLRSWKRM